MSYVTFQGASDDLVEIDGCEGADEFNVYPNDKTGYAGTWALAGNEIDILIDAFYKGCWSFMPRPRDEGVSFGPVDIKVFGPKTAQVMNNYTTCLSILTTPDSNVRVYKIESKGE